MLALCALLGISAAGAQSQDGRPLTVDDMLRIEALGSAKFSPDGKWLVFERLRSAADTVHGGISHERKYARSEVYVVDLHDDDPAAKPLLSLAEADTSPDGRAYSLISWSEDGEHLALWSLRDGLRTGVAIWTPDTGKLIDYRGWIDTGLVDQASVMPVWLDSDTLAYATTPAPGGVNVSYGTLYHTMLQKSLPAWRGEAPSVSVYSSTGDGVPVPDYEGALWIVDTRNGESAHEPLAEGRFIGLSGSRDGNSLAAVRYAEPFSGSAARFDDLMGRVENMAHRRRELLLAFDGDAAKLAPIAPDLDVVFHSIAWSSDGRTVLFQGYDGESLKELNAFLYEIPDRRLTKLNSDGIALSGKDTNSIETLYQIGWAGKTPVAVAVTTEAGTKSVPSELDSENRISQFTSYVSGAPNRIDVYALDPKHPPRNLTALSAQSVQKFYATPDGGVAIVADGALKKLNLNGEPVPLAGGVEAPVVAVLSDTSVNGCLAAMLLAGNAPAFRMLSLGAESCETPRTPGPAAMPLAFGARPESHAVFLERRGPAQALVLSSGTALVDLLVINAHLNEIRQPNLRNFAYEDLQGSERTAWMILPDDYEEGRRYPTIVWVYPSFVQVPDRPFGGAEVSNVAVFNPQFYATKGYAVLMPSAPLPPYDPAVDTADRLGDGIFPAMDRMVEMGVADPERFVVTGQSGGGFATALLLAVSDRFKAGITHAGLFNLVSVHGQPLPEQRFSPIAVPRGTGATDLLIERGVMNLGVPPWQNPERYVKNSPYFRVEEISAPLLIIHGDLDFNYADVEQMYKALARLGKDVTLIRYWGESHYMENAVNAKDQWERIFAWLDKRL